MGVDDDQLKASSLPRSLISYLRPLPLARPSNRLMYYSHPSLPLSTAYLLITQSSHQIIIHNFKLFIPLLVILHYHSCYYLNLNVDLWFFFVQRYMLDMYNWIIVVSNFLPILSRLQCACTTLHVRSGNCACSLSCMLLQMSREYI